MKLELNDFKKVKDDKHTITLQHPRHGHQINIAKNSLSQKMKSDFAAMPLHQAGGGEIEEPKEEGFLDWLGHKKDDLMSSVAPQVPHENPMPASIDPDVKAKQDMYNEYATGTFGPDAKIAQQNMSGAGILFEGDKAPDKIDPDIALRASNMYDAQKQTAQNRELLAKQATYEDAIKQNQANQALGLPAQPLPENPTQPQFQQTSMNPNQELMQAPPPPPMANEMALANDQAMSGMMKGFGEQKAGINAEANAQGSLGRAQANIANEQIQQQQNFQKHAQDSFNDLNKERMALIDDVKNNKINPNHYMENMSTAGKVGTRIGLLLSGFGSGITGGQNMALEILNKQIDRDIQAQANNLNTSENLLKGNLQQFGNMHDALNMTRIMQNDIYKAKIEEAAGKSADPMAKARAQQMIGQLDIQSAPLMQQMALKQAAFRGMRSGNIDPTMVIQYVAPEKDREHLMKSYQNMQNDQSALDNMRETFDQVKKINTPENRIMNPIQSSRELDALIEPTLGKLTKDTEGRVTPTDIATLRPLFKQLGDDPKTVALKQQKLNEFVQAKMHYPDLAPYGIKPKSSYKPASSFNLAPPVRK